MLDRERGSGGFIARRMFGGAGEIEGERKPEGGRLDAGDGSIGGDRSGACPGLRLAARSEAAIEALGRELVATYAVRVKTMPVDLSLPGAPQAMAAALHGAGVEIGVLVNNAGALVEGPFAAGELDALLNLMQINVVALTALTRLFLPAMVARGEGRILNVASIAAFMPVPQLALYAASKAHVLSLTEAIGAELHGTGVTATALCPGLTDTAMARGSALGRLVPAAMMMSPKDVAEAGCAACLRGEAISAPGLANRLITGGAPLPQKSLVRSIGGAMMGGGWERLAGVLQGLATASGRAGR